MRRSVGSIVLAVLFPVGLLLGYAAGVTSSARAEDIDEATLWVCTLSDNAGEIAECAAAQQRLAGGE